MARQLAAALRSPSGQVALRSFGRPLDVPPRMPH
jgi:hypothetical protein